jgi:hypothetical protein
MAEKEPPKQDFSKLSEENIRNYNKSEEKKEATKWVCVIEIKLAKF